MSTNLSSLDRRKFLRGAGVALALPWFESFTGLAHAVKQPMKRKRLACFYLPDGADSGTVVTADIFREWVVLGGMELGTVVAKWWTSLGTSLDGEVDALKDEPDETAGDLFWRICKQVKEAAAGGGSARGRGRWWCGKRSPLWPRRS